MYVTKLKKWLAVCSSSYDHLTYVIRINAEKITET